MFNKSKLFFWTMEILGVIAIIWLLVKINWIFTPITTLFGSIFIPFLVAGFLYYVFNPIINLLEKKLKISRTIGIILALLAVIGSYLLIALMVIPNIIIQMTSLVNTTIKLYPDIRRWITHLAESDRFQQVFQQVHLENTLSHISNFYTDILQNLLQGMTNSIGSIVGVIISIVFVLFLIPILLFYMLKDGHKAIPFVEKNILPEDKYNIIGLLRKMNKTISKYIFGISMDALFVFVMVIIGYLIMGVPFAFLFALFSAVTNLIPYIGPYIGVLPVIFTLAFDQPIKAVIAVIYVLIVQQIDGNVVFPRIVGTAINVHPMTVMILMMLSGSLYGLLGMIVAVPTYALLKEILKFVVALYRNIKKERQKSREESITQDITES